MRLSCYLGFHRWYMDSAFLSSAERCNFCPAVKDPVAVVQLNRERQLWKEIQEAEPNLSLDVMIGKVYTRLFSPEEILARNPQ